MSSTTFITSLPLTTLRLVRPPRATRKFVVTLLIFFAALPVLMLVVPWQQNVPAGGRVIALDPLDRTQIIPAPVTGRLITVNVQEGSYVRKGDVLAEMADQDPGYSMRLQQQFGFSADELKASEDMVKLYNQQLVYLEDAREQAISSATFALNGAIEKVREAEQNLEAIEADFEQKFLDFQRKTKLLPDQVVSELAYQKAEADYLSAKAKVESAKAKVEQARNEEKAKMADIDKIASSERAKIESTKSSREEARAKVAAAEKKLNDATTKLERQKTQVVEAPRTGYVQRVHAAGSADLLSQGAPLIELIPETDDLAVELWVRGVDAPLVVPGRKVRLQFEGWPAVQFAGWPSVAVGTFGGVVSVVDAFGNSEGKVRILVVPDPEDEPWPELPYLRQGVRANAWLLLDTVRIGYEVWRQLNAFPPTVVSGGPSIKGGADKPKSSSFKASKSKGDGS